ncbi:MAG: hypothetical protein E7369_04525 [Clostridiales bacterium]|nr:hypothetical protein [Clostridiales bacterium]
MNFESVLRPEEIAVFTLRALYSKFGYVQYKMSKFEEYDLYVKNKDFLVSDNVITFTDTDGRLLALKPDVTLSIIKNSKDMPNELLKVYYNENVYRVSKGTRSYKEIMQAGLECLGNIDSASITEVLFLAAKSLDLISEDNVLEIADSDIVSSVLDGFEFSEFNKKQVVSFLGDKNVQGVNMVCRAEGLSQTQTDIVEKLVTLYGSVDEVLPKLSCFAINKTATTKVKELSLILSDLKFLGVSDKICVDFSVVNNMKYYNGLQFRGFVEGLPDSVLSGGQYDKLMNKMHKKSRAIGFAVYLDGIDRLSKE